MLEIDQLLFAEKYFINIKHDLIKRQGKVDVYVKNTLAEAGSCEYIIGSSFLSFSENSKLVVGALDSSSGVTSEQKSLVGEISNLKFLWGESTNLDQSVLICSEN